MPARTDRRLVDSAKPAPLLRVAASPIRSLLLAGRFESPIGFAVGASLLACSTLAIVSAGIGAVSGGPAGGGDDALTLAAMSALWLLVGAGFIHQCRIPERLRSTSAFVGVFIAWLTLSAASTITYLVLGTFGEWDAAMFESVAGFTTTATTVVADPELLSHPVLAWRAGTQWIGGLAGLLFVVAVLPSLGVGGLDVTTAGRRHAGTLLRSRRTVAQLRRLASLYVLLTVSGIALYLVGGMDPFDSITYAATTISTGGFANHAGSFGHFQSTAVEWAGVGGMILGGANLALLFRAARGRELTGLLKSFELRAYLTLIMGAGIVVAVTTAPSGGPTHTSIRHALFHVTSASSTTGHFVGSGWGTWDIGPQVLLLAIMGVGAMSGSAGGGFRMVRALALTGYLRRELVLQLHPRAVASVRVGRRPVTDELVNRMIAYQAQYLLLAGTGAIVLGALGVELVTAMSAAISAIANVGPALGDLVPGQGGVLTLPRPARGALLPLMLLGRLEIAPALVGVTLLLSTVTGAVRRSWDAVTRDRE